MRMARVEYSVHLWDTLVLRIRYLKVPVPRINARRKQPVAAYIPVQEEHAS